MDGVYGGGEGGRRQALYCSGVEVMEGCVCEVMYHYCCDFWIGGLETMIHECDIAI